MKLLKSDFSKNVLTVLSGSSLALLIALLLSPLLSRFFSPEQFGYLAVYASLAAIGSVFASLRFELTIVLAPTDRYAYYLLLLAFGLTAIFSAGFIVLSGIVVMAIPDLIARHIPPFVIFPMLTVGIFLTTANLILTSWGTRRKRYKGISQARVIQALTLCSGQVALGALSLSGFGLILGHALGAACMMLKLLQEYVDEFRRFWRTASLKRVVAVAKRYKDFPRFMVIGQLANVVSGQAPVILLAFLYDSHAVGLYSLPERVLVMPCAFIASSIGEVYRQEAAATFNRIGNCRSVFLKTAKKLAILGAVPAVVTMAASPFFFSIVFGDAWAEAGKIAAVLGALIFFQTVVSPLSYTVLLTKMYRLDLIWQVTRLVLVGVGIWAGYYFLNSLFYSVVFLVAAYCVMYALHFVLQYKAACGQTVGGKPVSA